MTYLINLFNNGLRPWKEAIMKLTTLENAIRYYIASADCHHELDDALDALSQLNSVAERIDDRSGIGDHVAVVTIGVLTDLLNVMTYDAYGKLARRHNGNVPFDYYAHEVRRNTTICANELTKAQLECGYDIVSDLWRASEESGDNNADGTFNKDAAVSEPQPVATSDDMTRAAYLRYIEELAASDIIDQDAFDAMYQLAPAE